ncbi:MAG: hypothetical protein VX874_09450 [Pseudomonadota bacterium]|nr:hypothetical protein [Pseudomonadota bacterium]
MITAKDLEYHTPEDAGHTWAETYYFPIAIPEEHIMVTIYVVVRPGLGVMVNDIAIYGTLSDTRDDLLYFDVQPHLPAPERWADISSPSGLSIKAVNAPMDYRIDYVGHSDTEIHVDWKGLMEPFDIHDPAHSPKAAKSQKDQHAGSGLGAAWGGHFDQTGRVTGTVKIRGREYKVDCVERMDHSWGHRNPVTMNAQNSISASFGEDLAFHIISIMNVDELGDRDQTFAHGYVLDNGEVFGLADAEIVNTRLGSVVTACRMDLTDTRGKRFLIHGFADIGAPWNAYAATVTYNSMTRWLLDGREGYGCAMETVGIPALSMRRGRRWNDPQPKWQCG